ncbi:hypothetical protein [Pseudomonas gessardii]|uniref:Type III secretion effector protein n=1 Tax=Pseudomonas gessardii TaxID=78544 RepID=A0ABS9FAE8_9PSED|nr:hypothetical protein [Pseudomonas gessardii]MCF4979790.1 hypothetical protein [Pseudomonas gessardii]MCF4992509.1 hypothetical protein [Pseudomonas gessardii]MCF5083964.1 hypothetical protein [Pseudomonas gessardii]MCF5094673.1 hypothetical protein [Pseudomonas gessardii]MCF5108513.1 hypothetical protein [Pseudomonas gessardii]
MSIISNQPRASHPIYTTEPPSDAQSAGRDRGPDGTSPTRTAISEFIREKSLRELHAFITPENVIELLRNPSSKKNAEVLKKINDLLTAQSINSLLRGPYAKENGKILTELASLFTDKINNDLLTIGEEVLKRMKDENEERRYNMYYQLISVGTDGDNGVLNLITEWQHTMDSLQRGFQQSDKTAGIFLEVGSRLSKSRISKNADG